MERQVVEDSYGETKTYAVRWLILAAAVINSMFRGFYQSCYGPINNVLVKFLQVKPWQIDWLVIVQSVIILVLAIPFAWITKRIGLKMSLMGMSAAQCVGCSLLIIGCWVTGGYYSMLIGQAFIGVNVILGYGIIPVIPALWFPSNEVASAVAIQLVARGAGEALGSVTTTLIVNIHQSNEVVSFRLTMLFAVFLLLSLILLIITYVFIPESPVLPPSIAQMKKQVNNGNQEDISSADSIKQYCILLKELLSSLKFMVVASSVSVLGPVLRSFTILLSSMLHKRFPSTHHLNQTSGDLLLGAWILYTVATLFTGPIITKTKRYRAIMAISAFSEFMATVLIFLGFWYKLLALIYTGVLVLGIGAGLTTTSLVELLVEITYPKPPFLVIAINMVMIGIIRLLYPIVGRVLLNKYGAALSTHPTCIYNDCFFIACIYSYAFQTTRSRYFR
ncbi:choline/ethanolamine transporter flvcr2a-like [Ciona intestinalis]